MPHSLGKDVTVRAGWRVRGGMGLQPPHGDPAPCSWTCSPGPPWRGCLAPGLTLPEHEALQIPVRFKLLSDMDGLPSPSRRQPGPGADQLVSCPSPRAWPTPSSPVQPHGIAGSGPSSAQTCLILGVRPWHGGTLPHP